MPKVPYPYEVDGKLVTGNGSLIPIVPYQTVPYCRVWLHSEYQMLGRWDPATKRIILKIFGFT